MCLPVFLRILDELAHLFLVLADVCIESRDLFGFCCLFLCFLVHLKLMLAVQCRLAPERILCGCRCTGLHRPLQGISHLLTIWVVDEEVRIDESVLRPTLDVKACSFDLTIGRELKVGIEF